MALGNNFEKRQYFIALRCEYTTQQQKPVSIDLAILVENQACGKM
ncbi:hypothetical protein [Noviherbaspirillum galbum]|nr:hypothetical protein [Noviherbaspirillum galbum]